MTTLPERLLAAASGMERAGNTITARLLAEAAQALQAAPEGGCRTPIAWAVETEHYGRGYSFSNEFIETFPNAPVSFGTLYVVAAPFSEPTK